MLHFVNSVIIGHMHLLKATVSEGYFTNLHHEKSR